MASIVAILLKVASFHKTEWVIGCFGSRRCLVFHEFGGWKSVAMVRRYRKIVDERIDDVMDAFNEDDEEQISER